jgi:hypothetical protein
MHFPSVGHTRTLRRTLALAAGVALLATAGCASTRLAAARDDYLRQSLGSFVYGMNCQSLWPEVIRLLASKGYQLVGIDRAVAGQPPQSALGNFFSEGFATRETYDGGLTVATSWDQAWVRYRATGIVVPPGRCSVTFTRDSQPDTDDPGKSASWLDWEMALELLQRVDPAAAGRIEAGMPRAAP